MRKERIPRLMLLIVLCTGLKWSVAQPLLPKLFGDSMVLQRDLPIKIWGWATPGETVTVKLHGQMRQATTGADGKWKLQLDSEKAGGPYDMEVHGRTSRILKGILFGDVWVCSGQSNMEFPVKGWSEVINAEEEIRNASYPGIRLFTVEKNIAALPAEDVKGGNWQRCDPGTISPFSAVGYFFGRAIHQRTGVPIGLINTTWGGTNIETWTSRDGFEADAEFSQWIASFPEITLDSMYALRRKEAEQYINGLYQTIGDTTGSIKWKEKDYDHSSWAKMILPGLWDNQPWGARFDGVVWYRKEIWLDDEPGKTSELHLGMIDDSDETYLNGVKLGTTAGYNVNRVYAIPDGVLQKGKNTIAVKVEDSGAGGGIYGDSAQLFLLAGNKRISLSGSWSYHLYEARVSTNNIGANEYPSLLYNAMIHPLVPFGIKGAIWYQGEANVQTPKAYAKQFPLMISDWRKHWQQGDFPFYFVQLTSFNEAGGNSNKGSKWAELREAQQMATRLPHTGMAVTIDIGDANDIHPRNKQEVGARLAAIALQKTYGIDTVASGPVFQRMKIKGNNIIIRFAQTGTGLSIKPGDAELKGFEIAGVDGVFYPATAVIQNNKVVVATDQVKKPVAVRYAWADDAGAANLFNKAGLPAAPFRTDSQRP